MKSQLVLMGKFVGKTGSTRADRPFLQALTPHGRRALSSSVSSTPSSWWNPYPKGMPEELVKTSQSLHPEAQKQQHIHVEATSKTTIKRPNAVETRVAESLIMDIKRYEDKHEEMLRNKTTPEALLNVTLLEEELRQEMAVCLGRMETRLREKLKALEEANSKVLNVLSKPYRDVPALIDAVKKYNEAQEQAYEARRDLIVQRHSAGFRMSNYELMLRRYPIPPKKVVRETVRN